jgi:hypothetical protein
VSLVVVVPTVFQLPPERRWILTGTLATHVVGPPAPTLTTPRATRCLLRLSVMLLRRAVVTVKSDVLIAVPPGVVTVMRPVVAPVGTVAVILAAELTMKVAVTPLNLTEVAPVTLHGRRRTPRPSCAQRAMTLIS